MRPLVRVGLALAVLVALSAGLLTAHLLRTEPSKRVLLRLTPTDSKPYSTGCRDKATGAVGPCDPNAAYCVTDVTVQAYTGTLPIDTTTGVINYVKTGTAPGCDMDGQPRIDLNPPIGCYANPYPDGGADESYAPGCEPYGQLLAAVTTQSTQTITTAPSTTTVPTTSPTTTAPAGFDQCASVSIAWGYAWTALQASTLYAKWAAANPGELSRFQQAFPAANVSAWPLQGPVEATAVGKALVGFANMRARACHA